MSLRSKSSHRDTNASLSTLAALCFTTVAPPALLYALAEQIKPIVYNLAEEVLVSEGVDYVHSTQKDYLEDSQPILESDLSLPQRCFSEDFLKDIRVARVDTLPLPDSPYVEVARAVYPEEILQEPAALCIGDMIFIKRSVESPELAAVHELVHTWQIRTLGEENFVRLYLYWGFENGYKDIPLEKMAYRITSYARRALTQQDTLPVEKICEREMQKIMQDQDLVLWPLTEE